MAQPDERNLEESHTLPTHEQPVSSAFATLPEAAPGFADQYCFADTAILGSVDLLAGTEATNFVNSAGALLGFFKQEESYQIIRLACSFGWSVSASWHLVLSV